MVEPCVSNVPLTWAACTSKESSGLWNVSLMPVGRESAVTSRPGVGRSCKVAGGWGGGGDKEIHEPHGREGGLVSLTRCVYKV